MGVHKISADYYDQSIKDNILQRLYHLRRFGRILQILEGIEGDFLDAGCASGLLTAKLAAQTKGRGWGIDVNPDFIRLAKRKYPHLNFSVAAIEKLPFPKEKFHLVICSEVLEHVVNPQRALKECRRILKKRGKILVIVPSESLLFRFLWLLWIRTKGKVWQGTHLHSFNGEELKKNLQAAGFKILGQNRFNLGMLTAILAEKS